jgi:glycosyltransferase involved in cell wall biosynthesis
MYKITFPISVFSADDKQITIPTGLARDILTQVKYQPQLRIICPRSSNPTVMKDACTLDLADYPGLSFRFLPWGGWMRTWPLHFLAVRAVLLEEVRDASVWHTACGPYLWDVTTLSYNIGRRHAKGIRVFCLDSDPTSLLKSSGGWLAMRAGLVDAQIKRRVADADATIFVGAGVQKRYEHLAPRSLGTQAVWLQSGDLAKEEEVRRKFEVSSDEPIRMMLPVRLEAWKGADDVIQALIALGDRIPKWTLDIMGEGPYKEHLVSLARNHKDRIRFLDPVPYGPPFFEKLRSYQVVYVPTRGLEEQRVAYDAAASGCVLIHSRTVTLETSLGGLKSRWSFEPGNVNSLADTIAAAVSERSGWTEVGLAGVEFMSGRTIDEMHRQRAEFINSVINSVQSNTAKGSIAMA